jgi:hypothetical protein
MPVINPFWVAVNLTPTSVALPSPLSGVAGIAVPLQRLHGHNPGGGAVATPVPVKPIVSGLPGVLSTIDTVALRVARAVGMNVTLMMQ